MNRLDFLLVLTIIIFTTFLVKYSSPANAEFNPGAKAVISNPVSSIFSEPDRDSEILTQTIMGDEVEILENRNAWIKVSVPDGYKGWTEAGSVKIIQNIRNIKQWSLVKMRTAALRREPSEFSPVKITLVLGTKLEILQRRGRWLNLSIAGEPLGWLNFSDADIIESGKIEKKSSDDIIITAKKFLGTPYLWGGVTTLGADCSGFVYSVFKYNGIFLPRDADQQFFRGTAVNINNLEKGDLVFFRTYLPDVSHVGIYCGSGKFIQCSSYAGVIISDMTSGYYKEVFCGARRILP